MAMKKKFICTVCGYVHEGEEAPEFCQTIYAIVFRSFVGRTAKLPSCRTFRQRNTQTGHVLSRIIRACFSIA